jgi:acetate kinase
MQLVINPGSASKKYSFYEDNALVLSARFERNADSYSVTISHGENEKKEDVTETMFVRSLERVLEEARLCDVLSHEKGIDVIGVRIVAPGTFFAEHRLIDEEYMKTMEDFQRYAPLHISSTLREVQLAKELLPQNVMYGISDSEFHKTIPETTRTCVINPSDAREYDIRHFGYHGLSVQSVFRKVREQYRASDRVIVCHLGSGMSITALKEGRSVETSMGFTPATGLPMNVRTGDLDHEALLYLMQRKNLSIEDTQAYLKEECGYRALTGGISDMRVLLEHFQMQDEKATFAINVLKNRIKKYIGSYIAVLGGLDVIALTATMNERNATARALFFSELEHLGISIDSEKNASLPPGNDGCISPETGAVVAVVHTDEMKEIARVAQEMRLHQ